MSLITDLPLEESRLPTNRDLVSKRVFTTSVSYRRLYTIHFYNTLRTATKSKLAGYGTNSVIAKYWEDTEKRQPIDDIRAGCRWDCIETNDYEMTHWICENYKEYIIKIFGPSSHEELELLKNGINVIKTRDKLFFDEYNFRLKFPGWNDRAYARAYREKYFDPKTSRVIRGSLYLHEDDAAVGQAMMALSGEENRTVECAKVILPDK